MEVLIAILLLVITLGFYLYIELTYKKYKSIKVKSNLSGFEIARKIIDNHDLNNVYITESNETLFSRYDASRKVIRLRKEVFNDESLTSCAVSSMEAAHCIQDKKKNKLLKFRNNIYPFLNILLLTGYLITIIGFLFGHKNTFLAGISIEYLLLIFHLCTYSIEKEAKKIAIIELIGDSIINKKEINKIEKLLTATTFIYFASIIFPVVQLIKKIIDFGKSN